MTSTDPTPGSPFGWGGRDAPPTPAPPTSDAPAPSTTDGGRDLGVGDLVVQLDADGAPADWYGIIVELVDLGADPAYNGPLDSEGRPTRNRTTAARVTWLSGPSHPIALSALRPARP